MRTTHDGKIGTDELFSPGHVWFRCSDYNLPDNTMGKTGYHCVYRPMCRPDYIGTEVVTDQMIADTKGHYDIIKAQDEETKKIENEKFFAELEAEKNLPKSRSNQPCPLCGTYCDGDCTAN